jgi:3-oxoacyl-[acyl-carrier protein] reductase
MELELNDKVAFVTGSSRGIGKAIADKLYAEGCRVVINGRNSESLANAAKDMPGVTVVQGDVSQPLEAKRVVNEVLSKMGNIDILICNVGSGSSVPPGDESYEEWQRIFALNIWSTTNTVEAARETLSASHGVVVCISSICGNEVVNGAPVTYSAAKAALNAYIRGIARPLGKLNVRINGVVPGNIMIPGGSWDDKLKNNPKRVKQIIESTVTLERFGTVDEIADATLFLCSNRASFITGSCLVVDGGQTVS